MDVMSQAERSALMSRIRSCDTKPELFVRRHLHALGFRYRLHPSSLPGHPDIVLPKWNVVVFVHGCFWHRHEGCRLAATPKSNIDFWERKFKRNVERDQADQGKLRELGWRVLVVWECEAKAKLADLVEEIQRQ